VKIRHHLQMRTTRQRRPTSLARRHFMAAASAAALRTAAVGALITAAVPARSAPARSKSGWGGRGVSRGWSGQRGGWHGGGPPQCFLVGTQIQTACGEIHVEGLKAGDLVKTVSGEMRPIRWVGRRTYRRGGARLNALDPIRIARDAIEPGRPRRDLYLSPWHFLLLDGYLMPAKDLVNGVTIRQMAPAGAERLQYFHLALDTHDVISAEGVDVESLFVSDNEHEYFSNFAEYERLYPSGDRMAMTPYAPRVWYSGGRSQLLALLKLGASSVVDVRDPIQKVYERLAARSVDLCTAYD
jgi:hypothetical protein